MVGSEGSIAFPLYRKGSVRLFWIEVDNSSKVSPSVIYHYHLGLEYSMYYLFTRYCKNFKECDLMPLPGLFRTFGEFIPATFSIYPSASDLRKVLSGGDYYMYGKFSLIVEQEVSDSCPYVWDKVEEVVKACEVWVNTNYNKCLEIHRI